MKYQRRQFDLNAASRQALDALQAQSVAEGVRLTESQIANAAIIEADRAGAALEDPGPWDREKGGQLTVFFSAVAWEAMGRLRERTGWGMARTLRAALIWWAAQKS